MTRGYRQAPYGWVVDDFVDAPAGETFIESDPWDPNVLPTVASGLSPPDRQGYESEATAHPVKTDSAWDFVDELADIDPNDQWSEDALDLPSDWIEPDPTIDARSELSKSLYPADETVTDITRELKIGELLAQIQPITDEQRTRCYEVLRDCGIGRLRRWIPWLSKRAWCGKKLQLFLEFRCHWESSANIRWWETFHWDYREQDWMPSYQSGTLTLDHGRELVERRAHCDVAHVIDPAWFLEWENDAVWELGVRSFASFAVFRAGITNGDDWREHLSRQDRRTQLEIAQCSDGSFAPFMLPTFGQQYGFPRVLIAGSNPLPGVAEIARRNAAALGGDHSRSWREVIDRLTGY
ncbi:MAG: hypothetical protein OXH09_14440 [Gammaproteobacteria bacterium]|nr:hypothetical protein [Gammaproteobacteria bacterium]